MEYTEKSRIIFLEACRGIASYLSGSGFKQLKGGQVLRRSSVQGDIVFDIFFQSSFRNTSTQVCLIPQLLIYSKRLKEWKSKLTGNQNERGMIYTNSLGHICPTGYKEWNVAGIESGKMIPEIAESLNAYAIPIFGLFEDRHAAIEFLRENGSRFNPHTERSLFPLDFLLCFGTKMDSELFFNDFVKNCSYGDRIISFYQELQDCKKLDLNYSEFYGADRVKLAFIHGLKLYD